MFTLVTVDVNLCHARKKSLNNTQHEVNDNLDRIDIPDWLAAGRNVALTFAMNR